MANHHDEPLASRRPGLDDNAIARARTDLTEALAVLCRLTQDPLFERVERRATDLGVPGSDADMDTASRLRNWSGEYKRAAIELEAAARSCRIAEREIDQRADALLAGREGELTAARERNVDARLANIRQRTGPLDGLRVILHRNRADSRRPAERQVPDAGEDGPLPRPLSVAPVASHPAPMVPMPAADIAAWALGPLEVFVAGQRVSRWNSLKARVVFQYLLIHQDRPTRRDVLMALQWPDYNHDSARNNLNVALHSLRNTLDGFGPGVQPVLYRDGCYVLNPGLTWWVDRTEFLSALEQARLALQADRPKQVIDACHKAIRLYRGPLFEDDAVGEWHLPEQRRLKELYVQALEHVAEIHFELGQVPDAVRFGQLAVSSDPCCEPVHRLLMRCYASQHKRQLVSRQYRVCVAALHDELGVPPGEETVQLFRALTSSR